MKKRFQTGSVQKGKSGTQKVWLGLWYDIENKRKLKVLGLQSEMAKDQARIALAKILESVNDERTKNAGPNEVTLAQYTKNVYFPFGETKWKESSAGTTKQRMRQYYIEGEIGKLRMVELDRKNLQTYLDKQALKSFSVVKHLQWDIKAICDLAITDGILKINPALSLFTPRGVKSGPKPVMSVEDVSNALAVLDVRERVFCMLAIYAGIRPGEIIALRWDDFRGSHLVVNDRWYKGKNDTTKTGEERLVALSSSVITELNRWEQYSGGKGFIFASENESTPMRYENIWRRDIMPRFKKIGLLWANFRCMRRTNATLMHAARVDPKVSADNRGHGMGVSLAEYTTSTMQQKSEAVEKLDNLIQ